MNTIRQNVRETIENYTDEYLTELVNKNKFIAIYPDGDVDEIEYTPGAEDADEMRDEMLDFLGWFKEGFFDDEDGNSLMADIVNNDVCYEWGADPALLEYYQDKIDLLEYVKDYGVTESTQDNTDKYDWDVITRRLNLNRRFKGTIYCTRKWNAENPTFCVEWDPSTDPLTHGALDIYELEELLDDVKDNNVVFWNGGEPKTLTTDEEKTVVKEWLNKHDVVEEDKQHLRESYWKELTDKLGLPASYDGCIYTSDNGCEWKPELTAVLTVLYEGQTTYRFGIGLPNDLVTEHEDFDSDEQALDYGRSLIKERDADSVMVYRETRFGDDFIGEFRK